MANVLIVDDQPCVQELLCKELTDEGYRVASVGNARSAREHIMSSRPDMVVLDLYLDGANGFSLFQDIKKQELGLPVIIFTAYDSYVDDPRLSQADGYVIKNADLRQLKERMADVLGRKAALQETVEMRFLHVTRI